MKRRIDDEDEIRKAPTVEEAVESRPERAEVMEVFLRGRVRDAATELRPLLTRLGLARPGLTRPGWRAGCTRPGLARPGLTRTMGGGCLFGGDSARGDLTGL